MRQSIASSAYQGYASGGGGSSGFGDSIDEFSLEYYNTIAGFGPGDLYPQNQLFTNENGQGQLLLNYPLLKGVLKFTGTGQGVRVQGTLNTIHAGAGLVFVPVTVQGTQLGDSELALKATLSGLPGKLKPLGFEAEFRQQFQQRAGTGFAGTSDYIPANTRFQVDRTFRLQEGQQFGFTLSTNPTQTGRFGFSGTVCRNGKPNC